MATFSHELRTPLNAIIGYSELLCEDFEAAGAVDRQAAGADLQKIRGAGRQLLALIDDVLDMAKIEAGKAEVLLEPVDLPRLIGAVVDTIRPLAARRGNELVVVAPAGLPVVLTDVKMLRQSIFNLLSNACKFTENGRIELAVQLVDGPELVCRVSDTGIGMTPAQVARLFQAFHQADASITRKYGGTGLGLAISQRFCELLGGAIAVESELGRGSTFTLRVPVQVAAASAVLDA